MSSKLFDLSEFKYDILNNIKNDISETLILAFLAARICYFDSHPLLIFSEDRDIKAFLAKLHKAQHYSVFAHVPVLVDTSSFNIDKKFRFAKSLYKAFWLDNDTVLLNLRHIAEMLDPDEFKTFIEKFDISVSKLHIAYANEDGEYKWYDTITAYTQIFDVIPNTYVNSTKLTILKPKQIIVFEPLNNSETLWYSIIAYNFSRIFTQQLIRHTVLNVNERSFRYTAVDGFVLPTSEMIQNDEIIKETFENIAKSLIIDSQISLLTRHALAFEDVRYILPQGAATTIIASAPLVVWRDFVNKRDIKPAQGEIRSFASIVRKILNI